jgi:DNA polymerase-3 subunit alpha
MLTDEFLAKLDEGLDQFRAFEGAHSSLLVVHLETESHYEHGLVLHKHKLMYNQELMNWLRREMGALKLWVSGKPRR